MPGLRIGVNALYLVPGGVGGTEIYLRSLLAAFAEIDAGNRYLVFTNRETGDDLAPARPDFVHLPQPVRGANRAARLAWEQTRLPLAAARSRLDVLFNPGFTSPLLCPCPTVTVFHDLQHRRHPEHFQRTHLPFWILFLFQSACTSTKLIAVSEATRQDLLRHYPVSPRAVEVVPHGVDERFFEIGRLRRTSELKPYLLCVSTLQPHKNLERLIRAFDQFRRMHPGFELVVVGLRGFHTRTLEQLIAERRLEGAVRLTGWIPREQVYEMFLRAHAFLFPSTFEGFGMPVLEALAAGVPCGCSAIEPLRQISGSAALHFDPSEERHLVDAMLRLVTDSELRSRLSEEGPRQAAGFCWRRVARQTLDILRGVVSSSSGGSC